MKTTNRITTLVALFAATAALLLAGSVPAQADLTGPKPPTNGTGSR